MSKDYYNFNRGPILKNFSLIFVRPSARNEGMDSDYRV